jgi:GT2 family glycosyltransferase
MRPAITIVILNWNGKHFLEQFLPSLLASTYPDFKVLVVDNGSLDDSLGFMAAHYPQVEVLPLDKNYGFTTGNNMALPHVKTPYYVLLNNDVEVSPGWLEPLVDLMDADPQIAAVQPKLLSYQQRDHFEYAGAAGGYIDALGYPFTRGRMFETNERDEGQYEAVHPLMWTTGACMLVRKSVTDRIGLFEDRFFAHMEEIDFCWRANNYGYKVMYQPQSVVWHLGGGTLPKSSPRKTYLNAHNSIACLLKNFPSSQVWYKFYFRLCLDGVWGAKAALGGDFKTVWAIVKAHYAIYFALGYWIKARRRTYKELGHVPKPAAGYYPKSIVWQYFIRGIRKFSELPKIR